MTKFFPVHLLPQAYQAAAMAVDSRAIRIDADGNISGDAVQELAQISPSALVAVGALIERLNNPAMRGKMLTMPKPENLDAVIAEWPLGSDAAKPKAPQLDAAAIYRHRASDEYRMGAK